VVGLHCRSHPANRSTIFGFRVFIGRGNELRHLSWIVFATLEMTAISTSLDLDPSYLQAHHPDYAEENEIELGDYLELDDWLKGWVKANPALAEELE
jgi:hypothetical protein